MSCWKATYQMELGLRLKHSGIPTLLMNQEFFGKRSYKTQLPQLMKDVRIFTDSLQIMKELYQLQFTSEDGGVGAHDWVDWLENDLWGWMNDNVALLQGYTPKMYALWEKFAPFWVDCMKPAFYHTYPSGKRPIIWYKIDCFLSQYLEKKNNWETARIFVGAMTPKQRREFISERIDVFERAHYM